MLYHSKRKKLCRRLLVGGAMCLAGLMFFSCSDKYDLDSEQPSNLNTVYGYLESQGNYTNVLRLIDDLNLKEVLGKTGNKTLFAANDAAFKEFYSANEWGVTKYSELTTAQKNVLLKCAMLDNPYSPTMLSTAQGPVKGEVCRRVTSMSVYDSVQVVSVFDDEIPNDPQWNTHWNSLRASQKPHASWLQPGEIVLMKDASAAAPMIHFTPKFLTSNKIKTSDIDVVYNFTPGTIKQTDIYVNNAKVKQSTFCKNGYVHEVDRVILPLDNMAELIRKNPKMQRFSNIIERFAAPDYSRSATDAYNIAKFGTERTDLYVDSVFVKRYFSARSAGSTYSQRAAFMSDKDDVGVGGNGTAALKFDPGWNSYVAEVFNNRAPMMEDMAMMLVPSDEALETWWNTDETGMALQRYFGTLENTPSETIKNLVNVNMLNSFIASVPSRFSTVLDDANDPLGIQEGDIEQVYMANNGVVMLTNKVFPPKSYSSVLFPTVIDTENLNLINSLIEMNLYDAYLNSMVSRYSFFVPKNNNGRLAFIDPVTYGNPTRKQLWEFYLNPDKENGGDEVDPLFVDIFNGTIDADGNFIKDSETRATYFKVRTTTKNADGNSTSTLNATVQNRAQDMLDNTIVIGEYVDGKHFYQTKGKNFVRVDRVGGSFEVSGSRDRDLNQPIPVEETFAMKNGATYVITNPLSFTPKSTADVLAETGVLDSEGNPEFSEFLQIMQKSGTVVTYANGDKLASVSQDATVNGVASQRGNLVNVNRPTPKTERAYAMLNANHYTVYAPTNAAMKIAYEEMGMPSYEDYLALEAELGAASEDTLRQIRIMWRDFIRYHVHAQSLFVDGPDPATEQSSPRAREYETMKPVYVFKDYDENGNPVLNKSGEYDSYVQSSYRINVTHVDNDGLTIYDAVEMDKPAGQRKAAHVVSNAALYNMQGREYWINGSSATAGRTANQSTTLTHSSSVVVHGIDRPLFYDVDQFKYVPRHIDTDNSVKRR